MRQSLRTEGMLEKNHHGKGERITRERGHKCHRVRHAHKKIVHGTHYLIHLISQIKCIKIKCLAISETSCKMPRIL